MASCYLVFFGGLCFLTFCGGLDGRVLVCCSISIFGTLLRIGISFMLLFLISCWGAVLVPSADVACPVVLLGMNLLKIWPSDYQLSKAATIETNYMWSDLCNLLNIEAIVAYLLEARTVEAEKQPLLDNGPYTCNRGTRHVRCDVMRQ
jgi:hypothetical protein